MCSQSNESCGFKSHHLFLCLFSLAVGAVVILSLPEIRRYVRLSSM